MVWWPTSGHMPRVPCVPKYQTNSPIDQRARFSRAGPALARLVAQQPVSRCARHRRSTRRLGLDHPPPSAGARPARAALRPGSRPPRPRAGPPALILDHAPSPGDRLHAAHRVVDAEFLLEMADEDVHRGHVNGSPPMNSGWNDSAMRSRSSCTGARHGHRPTVGAQHREFGQHLDQVQSRCIGRRPRSSNPNQ
jgi:hypothetical protein